MRQHFHAARRGSQSAYQAKTATPDCNERVQVHRERCRFKPATLKAVFADELPATLNAERDARKIRDVRRAFPAPIFSNCAVGQAGGVTARPVLPRP
jgi:hypothetical protein